jgi:ABC-2 type transport system permease protein
MSAVIGTPSSAIVTKGGMPRRIAAMVMRYLYLIKGSWARLLDLIYWPIMQVVLWGFISRYLAETGTNGVFAQAATVLLSAALLWDILFRSQLGVAMSFLEELWSRNLGHLMVSPLRPSEFALSLFAMSFIRSLIGFTPASIFAIVFFGVSIYQLGFVFILFFFNLAVMGWGIGLALCGMILRLGMGAEGLVWAFIFALAPLCGIYYPVEILPHWCQAIASVLPARYVFEGMRGILLNGEIHWNLLIHAAALNVVYLLGGTAIFLACVRSARVHGKLLQLGE